MGKDGVLPMWHIFFEFELDHETFRLMKKER